MDRSRPPLPATTTWSSSGGSQTVVTTRTRGQSDKELRMRHQIAYLLAVLEEGPVP